MPDETSCQSATSPDPTETVISEIGWLAQMVWSPWLAGGDGAGWTVTVTCPETWLKPSLTVTEYMVVMVGVIVNPAWPDVNPAGRELQV